MDFLKIVEEEKKIIEEKIADFFLKKMKSQDNPFIKKNYSDLKHYVLSGGKRLRPIALISAYKGKGGEQLDEIYKLSISVELLHNASLIHDDIIDHDSIRRGEPSFHINYQIWFDYNLSHFSQHQDFGMAMGILSGDHLIDLGLEPILLSNFSPKSIKTAALYYQQAFNELINGVLYETYLQNLPLNMITEENYLEMIEGKTAALFEKSILIGALLGDISEREKSLLSKFAFLIGKAFQIRDDTLGAFGIGKEIGKSTDSDIREGKKTLLAIYTYKKNPEVQELLGKPEITDEEIEMVRNMFKETRAVEKTRQKSLSLTEEAKKILNQITFTEEIKEFYLDLVDFVQFREI